MYKGRNGILQLLKPEEMEKLQEKGRILRLMKGQELFRERETVHTVYFCTKGYFALHRSNRQQERRIVFVLAEGEVLNEIVLEQPVASVSAVALTDAEVLAVDRERLNGMLQDCDRLREELFNSCSLKLRRLYHQLANTSNNYRTDRLLASKLWKLARDFGVECPQGLLIPFDVSVNFLAESMGAKRETVSRAMAPLKKEGIILHSRNKVIIPDMGKLKKVSYNY